jgi:hypothetical protein
MSSKAASSILVKAVSSHAFVPIVLHMDATYKLNVNEFLVLTLGLSDAQQQFHLLSISVLLHHAKAVYWEVLHVFKQVIIRVIDQFVSPRSRTEDRTGPMDRTEVELFSVGPVCISSHRDCPPHPSVLPPVL